MPVLSLPSPDPLKARILTSLQAAVPTDGLPPMVQAALPLLMRMVRAKVESASPGELLTFVKTLVPQLMDLLADEPECLREFCAELGERYAYLWE